MAGLNFSATSVAAKSSETFAEHDQAFALWSFIQLNTPRFSNADAADVIRRLNPRIGEDHKTLAKRLRNELRKHGVELKHTTALKAAARLLGDESWYAVELVKRLRLYHPGATAEPEIFVNWAALAPRLCALCDALIQQGGVRLFEAQFGPSHLMINTPMIAEEGKTPQSFPVFVINPVDESADWLEGAAGAMENLRRHLEETRKAVLDGVATLQICAAYRKQKVALPTHSDVIWDDVPNSELVLIREDNELYPGSGFEIARGDELTCWSQLELANDELKSFEITVTEDAWRLGDGRYIWQLSTVRPKEYTPGLIVRMLGHETIAKLHRRYRLARRIFPNGLEPRQIAKPLNYLNGPGETYRVNQNKVVLAIKNAGVTWKQLIHEMVAPVAISDQLPVGFVISLIERLKLKDPNSLFARPTRADLTRTDDDSLLRTLFQRVDHVTYRLTPNCSAEDKKSVETAIEEFSSNVRMRALLSAGFIADQKKPFPYFVYSGEGENLRLALEELGMVMFVGTMPRLLSTEHLEGIPKTDFPYAIGTSLYLDIDYAEGA
ncbi:MAG: hypothetical protein WCK63_04665 [Betaproteobacteria bacterium]